MRGRQNDHGFLPIHQFRLDLIVIDGAGHDSSVDALVAQGLQLFETLQAAQRDVHAWVALVQLAEEPSEPSFRTWSESDCERSALGPRGALSGLNRLVCLHQQLSRFHEEYPAGSAELQVMLLSPEERGADNLFEPPYLLAQRRLHRVQPLRRAREVQLFSDRDEVSQVS